MDLRKLKTLIDLVSESNISELEITEAEGKVRIVKNEPAPHMTLAPVASVAPAMMPVPAATASAPAAPAASAPATGGEVSAPAALEGKVIKSPMVGTFYRSSSPGGAPFVEVGSTVKEGDTVCIIEAMKILNEIESDQGGTITQILVENGQPVEYGQPLFVMA
ncbi:MAG: acetyl-CoA carboxylase biotin carboxyl carrier protein [Betaproteobacteria bacterium]|jgi:acetyl-CoA carboxylase biotin carboxyl carrier protein|nr:acetyl-CoA carboxylase biotin carboxyl carrier protein [Betaproteobacteria bacterium]NBP45283.1 acetyl-CoA carboxylase biotin carboxyl carrier protein [Betaproteobacteria bacterium]